MEEQVYYFVKLNTEPDLLYMVGAVKLSPEFVGPMLQGLTNCRAVFTDVVYAKKYAADMNAKNAFALVTNNS